MFSDIVADVASLIFPRTCPVCGEPLPRRGGVVCPMCEITAPLTNLWLERGNAMMQRFWGQLPVEQASAFFWYVNESDWRKMVHNFKYYGAWRTAYNLGRWYGACMKQGGLYDTVDVAVPVPLHLRRTLARGYNQSEMLAAGIARELGIKVDADVCAACSTIKVRRDIRPSGVGATSRVSSRCGMRTALRGVMCCWWTMSSPRAPRSFRAAARSWRRPGMCV